MTYTKNSNLDTVTRNGIIRKFSYDDNDNTTSNKLTVDAKVFEMIYNYDNLDNLNTITYPSSRVVTYAPNALGRSTQASPYVSNITYHPNGIPNVTSYANGVVETKTLTPNRDFVDSVTATIGTTNVVDINYDYDFRGNVTAITNYMDRAKDLLMTGYDGLDRLTDVSGSWGAGSISYDALGNITSKNIGTATLAYGYDAATNTLLTTTGIVNNTYQYDVYGNVKSNGTNTFIFDDASNMVSVTGNANLSNSYDGSNFLAKSVKNGITTYHLYDQNYNLMGEYNSSGTLRKENVRLNGKLVAVITEQPEALGSVAVSTPDGTGGYTISWPSSAGDLSHYEVAVSSSSSCDNVTLVSISTSLSYNVTNQTDGTYYYCVRACNGPVCGDYKNSGSSCAVVGTTSAPCLPPGNLSLPVRSTSGNYTASWLAATGSVTHYELYEADNSSYINQSLVYSGTALSFEIISKTQGTYFYQLRACNNASCSEYLTGYSISVIIQPIGPTSITAPAYLTSGNYTVSWAGATGNITHYQLDETYSAVGDVNVISFETYYILDGTSLDFVNKPEGYYKFTASACNGSVCSSSAGATTSGASIALPSKNLVIQFTPTVSTTISNPLTNASGLYTVNWAAATGYVTYYEVLEATDANFTNPALVYSGNALTTNIGLKPDATYYYKTRACNDASCSAYLTSSNATTVSGSPFIAVIMGIINNLLLN